MTLCFMEKYTEPIAHKLWASDYQPKYLDQILGNEQIIDTLKCQLKNERLPNLIFCGPHGCGKTTTAKILVETYLGPYYKSCHMEVIGSIYRGKNIVTEKTDKKKTNDKSSDGLNIVNFIRKSVFLPKDKCKVVTILDYDCMTQEAQMALRRIIELYEKKVRFIFICNDLNNIIEAIQSRALPLKFASLSVEQISDKLKEIAKINNFSVTDEIYQSIAIMANGDLKQALNCFQVFSNCKEKTIENFYHIFNIPSMKTVHELVNFCVNKQCSQAFNILSQLINNGYNVSDILDIIIKVISHTKKLNDHQRVTFINELTRVICINEISSSTTHLYSLIVKLSK